MFLYFKTSAQKLSYDVQNTFAILIPDAVYSKSDICTRCIDYIVQFCTRRFIYWYIIRAHLRHHISIKICDEMCALTISTEIFNLFHETYRIFILIIKLIHLTHLLPLSISIYMQSIFHPRSQKTRSRLSVYTFTIYKYFFFIFFFIHFHSLSFE